MEKHNWISNSEDETIELGNKFAQFLNILDTVILEGDLGAGKTEFIKGICDFFSVEDLVTSPTFTIINQYKGLYRANDIFIFHIDLYRIKNEDELDEIGFTDCLNDSESIKLIEWPQHAGSRIANYAYLVKIEADETNENKRVIKIF